MKTSATITVLLAVLCVATLFPFLRRGVGGVLSWARDWTLLFASWAFCCHCWRLLRRR